jgi:hypothetical protein
MTVAAHTQLDHALHVGMTKALVLRLDSRQAAAKAVSIAANVA